MLTTIIIFLIATVVAFGMLAYKVSKLRSGKIAHPLDEKIFIPDIPFRQVEKTMLYLTKHILQWFVLVVAKYWFTLVTKAEKWSVENLPKIYKLFGSKTGPTTPRKNSFLHRAIIESKVKIYKLKEKIKEEHK